MEEILMKCSLFENMKPDEITELLRCLRVEKKKYSKNDMVFTAGDEIRSVGVLLEGKLQILKEDFWGNRGISEDTSKIAMPCCASFEIRR